jgi:hypothetical protein
MHRKKQKKTVRVRLKNASFKEASKEEIQEEFFSEIDAGNYATFIEEDSFNDLLTTIKKDAKNLQRALQIGGKDHADFKILFPFRQYCACLAQCSFNRRQDVTFRYITILFMIVSRYPID